MPYLDITLEKDKWYISEGFKAMFSPPNVEDIEKMVRHNQGAHKMILAGPFDTKEMAESQLDQYTDYHYPFVWNCELGSAT
ncbi:hypothetical protein [Gimesia algae]|uniref:Uncharacterized protein n=1 Tax=Gimesia algae TaxID=2527971 RepID=A0A517VA25_9PLAN|nr:hypothetical protein [Gimesia algae]QDT89864.1 hypothetical protein Pan161_14970 [Gimesia algae]